MQIYRRDHVIFLASVFCFWLATYIYVPIFSLYLEHIQFPYGTIGVILGSYGVMQILLRFPLGILSDRLKHLRKSFYVSGFVIAAISGLILVFFESFTMVLIGRLLSGITAAMWVMATIMYTQYFNSENSGRAMGGMQFLTVMPQFASMITAGFLVESLGWLFPFWVGIMVSIIGLLLSLCIKVVPSNDSEDERLSFKQYIIETLKIKGLIPVSMISLLTHSLLFMSIFGFTPNLAASLGIGEQEMIWLMTAFFIPHAAASLFVAFYKLAHKSQLRIMFLSLLIAGTGLISLSLLHAIIGLALGFVLPICLSQAATLSPTSLKTSVMGFFQSFYALGIFISPLIAGRIADWFYLTTVFILAGVTSLFALLIVFFTLVAKQGKYHEHSTHHVSQ
ncbi:MFS family permease [Geomicrobium halophilum]|uniref:MFS family permease n=1 Tax=Geomicrobium halophilum TaxID=549000 RepID=A0A841PZB9_9BACL|nr:MFS family permease [Geomicrobium halophilum]